MNFKKLLKPKRPFVASLTVASLFCLTACGPKDDDPFADTGDSEDETGAGEMGTSSGGVTGTSSTSAGTSTTTTGSTTTTTDTSGTTGTTSTGTTDTSGTTGTTGTTTDTSGTTGTTDSSTSDTGSSSTTDGTTTSTTSDTSTSTSTTGDECTLPTRMLVFGDSILAGFGVGDHNGADNAAVKLHEYIAETYAPGLTYDNQAVGGAVTNDVPATQMPGASVGQAGHTLVVIYIGGNDLAPYITGSDQAAQDGYAMKKPGIDQNWVQMFTWLEDPANFPDGVTLIMNTQYNPFDDCPQPSAYLGQTLSEVKIGLLHDYNMELAAKAGGKDYAHLADQHPNFLGHGHNRTSASCPHYDASADAWMPAFDPIHPNAAGHAGIFDILMQTADEIYADCM